jgi:site-specific DNA-cytosine methylase
MSGRIVCVHSWGYTPPNPYEFHKANVLELYTVWMHTFDAIHASPPCQFATAYKRRPGVAEDAVNLEPPLDRRGRCVPHPA